MECISIGGGSSKGKVLIQDASGKTLITLDGKNGDLSADGDVTADRLMATNEDGKVTVGLEGAKSGQIGDGKIFVMNLHECVRIRTGEVGSKAIG